MILRERLFGVAMRVRPFRCTLPSFVRRPTTFSEYLVARMLYCRDPLLTVTADKLAVRNYVRERVGERYLNQLCAVAQDAKDLDIRSLPREFVVKCTHSSGGSIIVADFAPSGGFTKVTRRWVQHLVRPAELDEELVREQLSVWLSQRYGDVRFRNYVRSLEWAYQEIPPRLIVEEFLSTLDGAPPIDYKLFVFAGKVDMIQLDVGRHSAHHRGLFNPDWTPVGVTLLYPALDESDAEASARPAQLEELIHVAERLAAPLEFARIDLFVIDKQVRFGEITHYPGAGKERFSDAGFDKKLLESLDKRRAVLGAPPQ